MTDSGRIVTMPDPDRTPHGQCSICHRFAYDPADVGKKCHFKSDKENRQCFGTFVKYTPDPSVVAVDGDKVIAFSNAVRKLADLFDAVNIGDIKEAFLVGRQIGTVESIIERQKLWQDVIHGIRESLLENISSIECGRKPMDAAILLIKHFKELNSPDFKACLSNLKEFSGLCDNIAKHREAGTLEIISQLSKPVL